jgi:hypothetical protein
MLSYYASNTNQTEEEDGRQRRGGSGEEAAERRQRRGGSGEDTAERRQ